MGEHQINKGSKLSPLLKNKLSKKKILAIVLIVLLSLLFASISVYRYHGLNMSKDQRIKKIYATLEKNKDYEEATKLADRYLKNDPEDLKRVKGLIGLYKNVKVTNLKDYQAYARKQKSENDKKEKANSMEIEDVRWEDDNDRYGKAVITVKNTGNKNIKYVKVNIFMYDSNNNIIDSYWTNSSSLIKPGAKLELEKGIPYKDNYKNATMNAEIGDISFQ